ncbi:MAG TPA: FMN-binding protein [Rectinemataceae bacterium]|nr:FMN-binding protein [Rectinemataceae bacterium]
MKGITRLGLVLAIFAAVGCAALAVVYSVTESAIAMQSEKALNESLKNIFPDAESFEDVSSTVSSSVEGIAFEQAFLVKSALAPLGLAVKATGSSYGGAARLLVGVNLNRSIAGVSVLELNDTAGLGANAKNAGYFVKKAEKITFPGQFAGKFITDAFEVKKDVVAITASTITSKSLTRIIKTAADAAALWLENSTIATATAPVVAEGQPAAAETAAETTGGK